MRRDDRCRLKFARKKRQIRGGELLREGDRGGIRQAGSDHDSGLRDANGAAISLHGLAGRGSATTVRGPVRSVHADAQRRKQSAHQYDGHRCAPKKAPQHECSLPRYRFRRVMCVTRGSEKLPGIPCLARRRALHSAGRSAFTPEPESCPLSISGRITSTS